MISRHPMQPGAAELELSVVVPAYNEQSRLRRSLERMTASLDRREGGWEIVVVDDGSEDETAELVEQFAAEHPCVRLLRRPHLGKGAAVRAGMLDARGRYRYMCDADLSTPIDEVERFLPPQLTDFDVAIGSREHAQSERVDEPTHRHWMGRAFNWMVRAVAVRGVSDTQCGFKCFRDDVAEYLFSQQRIDGFGFDVEILRLAQRAKLRVVQVPVTWVYASDSKVRAGRDAIAMAVDVLRVRWQEWSGAYERMDEWSSVDPHASGRTAPLTPSRGREEPLSR